MQLNRTEKRILAELVETLRSDFGAREVILYGSAARGRLEPDSDIDLLVELPQVNWEIEKKIIDRCFEAELECERIISTACFTRDELTRGPLRLSPFVLKVNREGVKL